MCKPSWMIVAAIALAAGFLGVEAARAQTGADLLLKPLLSEKELLEARADALFFNQGTTDNDQPFQLSLYRTSGRFREQRENFIPRIGWDFNLYNLDTTADLPSQLLDASVGIGLELPTVSGFRGGLSVGLGYAGDKPFAEGDAWYGKATMIFGKDISKQTTIAFVLDYDGSRTKFPDIPFPGFAYVHQFDPRLSYTLGFPLDSISWNPIDPLRIEASWLAFDTFNANIDYQVLPHLILFSRLESDQRAFHVEQIGGDRRLLFSQRRIELGVRLRPAADFKIIAAVGYAWDGGFESGFDNRNTQHVADISDEPYVRFGLEKRF